MAKLSKRTSSCLIFTNLWTFPAYHMDASKEKYYGNTCRWPKHFRELNMEEVKIFFVPTPFVVHVCFTLFQRVRVGMLESSQLSAKFSSISQLSANFLAISQLMVNFNQSLLIFLPQFYNAFFIKKISNACIN